MGVNTPLRRRTTRRSFVGLTATAFASLGLAACGGTSDDVDVSTQNVGAMEDFAADMPFKATEPITLTMLWTDWPESQVKDTWRLFEHIKDLTDVELKLTHVPFSDHIEKRSLLISAGDAPTLIPLVYAGEDAPFVTSGAIVPMSDYVEHMPNFQKYLEEWDQTEALDGLRQADGKLYMLPGLQEVSIPGFSIVLRKDVFDSVAGGVPETWEEFREALRAIKKEYPDSKPFADGFESQCLTNYASHAFGTRAGWGFGNGMIDAEGEELVYAATTEEYRTMLEYLRGLIDEDLLDREALTGANDGSGAGGIPEKFANETCFAASGGSSDITTFSSALDATVGEGNHEVVMIPPPGGPAGNKVSPAAFSHGFMLNSNITSSENFLAILQFVDWFYYNPEAREMLRWGEEGETYTKADSGEITIGNDYSLDMFGINVDAPQDLHKDIGYSAFPADATESRALKESYANDGYRAYIAEVLETREPRPNFPPAPLDEVELEQASLAATPLKDAVDTATLQFILGDRDVDGDWDAFLGELEAAGLPAYVDLINEARRRFVEDNG